MSWANIAIGVGSAVAGLGGAAMSANASKKAGQQAAAAANSASAAEQAAADQALQLQREQYRNAWALLAPGARDGRRAQSYINSILYGGRGATSAPAATPLGNDERVAPAETTTRAPQMDWAGYEAQWKPTTLNNPTSPWHGYLAQAQAADPNLSWGEAFFNWSGGQYGRPDTIAYEDTNDWLTDEYGDLMTDVPVEDLDTVMGDYRNTPMYQMNEDAIAADSAASDLATSKALEEFLHRAGASGGAISGNAIRGTADIRNEYGVANATSAANRRASTFGGWFDQLQGQAGVGRDATTGMVSGGQTFASNASNLIKSQGESASNAITASAAATAKANEAAAQAWGSGINTAITGATSAWDIYNRNKKKTADPNIQNSYWG